MFNPTYPKSFQDSLKNTLFLLKHSFSIIGLNTGIVRPTVYLSLLSLLMITLVFGALTCFALRTQIVAGVLALLIALLVLVPLRLFIRTFLKAIQSWMTYRTITGSPVRYTEARRHAMNDTPGLIFLGFVDMAVAFLSRRQGENQGMTRVITSMLMSSLAEVWDLLNHYMIPAVVVEDKPLKQLLPEIKTLRENVPATLAGVFGIDFAGDALRSLLLPAYLLVLAAGAGLGYLLGPSLPQVSWTLGQREFCWLPPLLALYLNCCVGGVVRACVESVKAIYFTIFYASIMHPDQIPEEHRAQLAGYLRMGS